jgi:hypothetical protein
MSCERSTRNVLVLVWGGELRVLVVGSRDVCWPCSLEELQLCLGSNVGLCY